MTPRALIDVHSHVVPKALPSDPSGGTIGAWPSVHCQACGRPAPILHRMEFGWGASDHFGGKLPQSPKAYARRFFFDSLVYDQAYLEHLTTHIAPGQVFLGTDYPYLIMQPQPAEFIASAAVLPGVGPTIWSDAAKRFLGVTETGTAGRG